jgi:hypothetical protein
MGGGCEGSAKAAKAGLFAAFASKEGAVAPPSFFFFLLFLYCLLTEMQGAAKVAKAVLRS